MAPIALKASLHYWCSFVHSPVNTEKCNRLPKLDKHEDLAVEAHLLGIKGLLCLIRLWRY